MSKEFSLKSNIFFSISSAFSEYLKFEILVDSISNFWMILLKSYDELLNDKYKVTLNKKTIERVKNYFQW